MEGWTVRGLNLWEAGREDSHEIERTETLHQVRNEATVLPCDV